MKARDLLVPVYVVGVLGALLQITGGVWDVSGHLLGIVDTFFTPSHTVLYSGIALVLIAAVVGLYVRFRGFGPGSSDRFLVTGLLFALVGGGLQVIAGPFDLWWHENFGFDPFLFTPPHSLLIVGIALSGIGMGVGAVRLLQASRAELELGGFPHTDRGLQLLALGGLTTLWFGFNGLVYLLADVEGMAYTFGLGQEFINQAALPVFVLGTASLGLGATLVFLSAKRILGWRGAATTIAALGASIITTASLAFQAVNDPINGGTIASFIPVYLAFLIPVALFDFFLEDFDRKAYTLLAAMLVAPFAFFLDGFYSLGLWTLAPDLLPLVLVPLLLAGLLAGYAQSGFSETLVTREMAALVPVRSGDGVKRGVPRP